MSRTATLPVELTSHLDAIRALCERFRIRALYVFGSAVHGTFDPQTSDFDFVVDLGDYQDDAVDRYFDFQSDLGRLLGREIDLITVRSRGRQQFLDEVNATRVPLYAA